MCHMASINRKKGYNRPVVVFDMNDLVAYEGGQKRNYVPLQDFEQREDKSGVFTLRPDDLIEYRNKIYTIVEIADINPQKDEPTFLEVIANEAWTERSSDKETL